MTEEKEKTYILVFTESELKNPNLRREMASLINTKTNLQRAKPFIEISEAELQIMNQVGLFTPIKDYGKGKYPNEVGKLKGKPVIIKK